MSFSRPARVSAYWFFFLLAKILCGFPHAFFLFVDEYDGILLQLLKVGWALYWRLKSKISPLLAFE